MYEELTAQLKDAARHKEDWGCYGCPVNCADSCALEEAADAIEELQAAILHQLTGIAILSKKWKTGKWIFSYDHGGPNRAYFCSNCKITIHTADLDDWSFCPNCGAKMEESTDV